MKNKSRILPSLKIGHECAIGIIVARVHRRWRGRL